MTEVMPLICDYDFGRFALHRKEGMVNTDNINCKKAMGGLQSGIDEGSALRCPSGKQPMAAICELCKRL